MNVDSLYSLAAIAVALGGVISIWRGTSIEGILWLILAHLMLGNVR